VTELKFCVFLRPATFAFKYQFHVYHCHWFPNYVLSVICHAQVGLTQLMQMLESLLQLLLSFYTSQVHRGEELRSLLVAQLTSGIQALKVLPPVQQILALPTQVRTIMNDLLELGQILIQLLINTTPLYDLVRTHTHTHTNATFWNQF